MKARLVRAALLMACLFPLGSRLAAAEPAAADEALRGAARLPGKSILVYQHPSLAWRTQYFSWLLYDPLLLANARLRVDVSEMPFAGAAAAPDLSKERISAYDLVIVAFPHTIRAQYAADLLGYLDRGGALLLVQPKFEGPQWAEAFRQRTGISLLGWQKETPPFSLVGDSPGARILGLPPGRSVYAHPVWLPHLQLAVAGGQILTRLAYGGDPDLAISGRAKVALWATDVESDIEAYHRGDPEFSDYKQNYGFLLVNSVRHLLGYGFFAQPVQQPERRWSELFYAYAAGREYVLSARQIAYFAQRLPAAEFAETLSAADAAVTAGAGCLSRGDLDGCRRLHRRGVELLSQCMQRMVHVERYLIRGWHGSICFDNYYGGGVLGYAESEWSDHLLQWVKNELDLARRSGARRLADFYGNDWEILHKYYPEEVALLAAAIRDGWLEPVHGLYSAAFLPILSAESNVRQLRHGLAAYHDLLGCRLVTYADPVDHFDFHPQLPQLLQAYGLKYAILHADAQSDTGLGSVRPIQASRIAWRGLDGTALEAVPVYAGLERPFLFTNLPAVAKADQLGYKTLLLGDVVDATFGTIAEQAHTLIDPIAPVSGTWVTAKEYFEKTPPAQQSHYLGVDELHANNLAKWSSWGCMNEASAWNRDTENLLLAAEKFSAVAALLDRLPQRPRAELQERLSAAWKSLLSTQDHMMFGAVDYARQTPPAALKPGEENRAKHDWGYRFPPLPHGKGTIGGMENYAEAGTASYAGPMIPTTRYEKVQTQLRFAQTTAGQILSAALDRIGSARPEAAQGATPTATPLCVFNPLGWQKRDLVTVDRPFPAGYATALVLSDGSRDIPYQVLAQQTHPDGSLKQLRAAFVAEVPALGYRKYFFLPSPTPVARPADASLTVAPAHLENAFYEVALDERHGGIRRIYDKRLKADVFSASAHSANELYSPADPPATSQTSSATIELSERGPLRATAVVRSRISELPYRCAISLYRDLPRIDFQLTIDFGRGFNFGSFSDHETGLFVLFPVGKVERLLVNQPFGIYPAEKSPWVALDFVDACQGERGVAVMHRNTPAWRREGDCLAMTLARGRPLAVGSQSYQYSIYPHAGDVHQAEIFRAAQGLNTPFVVSWPQGRERVRACQESFLQIDQSNIVLSTLSVEGDALCARLYEIAGRPTRANVTTASLASAAVCRVDLSGNRLGAVACTGGTAHLEFKPWEIITLKYDRLP